MSVSLSPHLSSLTVKYNVLLVLILLDLHSTWVISLTVACSLLSQGFSIFSVLSLEHLF